MSTFDKIDEKISNPKVYGSAMVLTVTSMLTMLGTEMVHKPEFTEKTSSPATEKFIVQNYNDVATQLIETQGSFSQEAMDPNVAATLNQLHEMGADFNAENASQESARYAEHQTSVTDFLSLLTTDKNLSEKSKSDLLKTLEDNNVLPSENKRSGLTSVFIDECSIETQSTDEIYQCATQMAEQHQDEAIDRLGIFLPIVLLFLLTAGVGNYRATSRHNNAPKFKH